MIKIKNRNIQTERSGISNWIRSVYPIARTNSWDAVPRIYRDTLKSSKEFKRMPLCEPFDYTEWRKDNLFKGMSFEEISQAAEKYCKENPQTYNMNERNNLNIDDIYSIRREHAAETQNMSFAEYKADLHKEIKPLLDLLQSMKIEKRSKASYSNKKKNHIDNNKKGESCQRIINNLE